MLPFDQFIKHLLNLAKVPENLIKKLLISEHLATFKLAFTHRTISETSNYEVFETLGDVSLNKSIIWHFKRILSDASPEQLTLLKIKFASTKLMSVYARELEFDKYILSPDESIRTRCKVLEDCFEAFIGCMEFLIDKVNGMHTGYSFVYTFVSVYIERYLSSMSIKEEDLLDPISTLKNIADKHRFNVEYVHEVVSIRGSNHVATTVNISGKQIAKSIARIKKQSKIQCAEAALQELNTTSNYLLKGSSRSRTPPVKE